MNSSERNLFLRLERQLYVDLKEWRLGVVQRTKDDYDVVEEALRTRLGGDIDVADPWIENKMNDGLSILVNRQLPGLRPEVHGDDLICVSGDILYEERGIYDTSSHTKRLGPDTQLRGRFQYIDVKDYFDEKLLEIPDERLSHNIVEVSMRHYGPHMVLDDVCEVGIDGSVRYKSRQELVFIPLMYHRLDLKGYLMTEQQQ